jgi:hypothetical protein
MCVPMAFDFDSSFQVRVSMAGNLTQYLFRLGVSCERVNDANDPTQRSYGIEACPADSKVLIFSADGSTRSTIPTVFNHDVAIHNWLLRHRSSLGKIWGNRDLDFTAGNTSEKTNNIPTDNTSASSGLLCGGIKTTDTNSKQLYYRGAVIAGMPSSSWRFFHPKYPES